jgi:large subunit ribosomal protein L19
MSEKKVKIYKKDLIKHIESKFVKNYKIEGSNDNEVRVGDIVRIGYNIPEGDKERTQYYEGLIISKNNRGLGKSFTLRRSVQGVGIEQIFLANSPKILSIAKKQSYNVRRAKLYFIRNLIGKLKLKVKL